MDFGNLFIPYIFEVKESVSRSSSKIPCSGDFKNLYQLPDLHVIEKTGYVVFRGHMGSEVFSPFESSYMTSYLTSISYRFRDIRFRSMAYNKFIHDLISR